MSQARLIVLCLAMIGCVGEVTDLGEGVPGDTSQGSGSDVDVPPPLTVMQYLTQLGGRQCAAAFACQASYPATEPMSFESIYGTSASACSSPMVASYAPSLIEAEIAAGNISFNPTAAVECLAGLTAGDCATFWSSGGITLATCRDVFHGSASDGDPCVIDLDCVNHDSICDAATSTCVAGASDGDD
jgi:hypothetical protein